MDNQNSLFSRYGINPSFLNGIVIWDYDRGFISEDAAESRDPYCFKEIATKNNCIEKNILLRISFTQGRVDGFEVSNDATKYNLAQNGRISRISPDL